MWLPEAAVDRETLEVLVNNGISFTVLSPRQAKGIRTSKTSRKWHDVSGEKIDPSKAYTCILPSGRSITLFFYDGPTSQEISFGGLLNNGEFLAKRLLANFNDERTWPQLVHIATDGETFGHHHRYGDMALAYALNYIEVNRHAEITNYGQFLEKSPPSEYVEIFDNSSWSCVHGIERWRDNCGCCSGMHNNWNQAWRKPLREALDWLRDNFIELFTEKSAAYLKNPWDARNEYIDIIFDRSHENIDAFLKEHALKPLSREESITVLRLFELQRNAMLMYTSCGWFFDEVSGIETVQILQYASKALQYAEELGGNNLEAEYVRLLQRTPSNIFKSAAEPYERYVKPAKTDLLRFGAHYCISSVFEEYPEDIDIYCYSAQSETYNRQIAGKLNMTTGIAKIISKITWEELKIAFAVLHLGDHNITAGVKDFEGEEDLNSLKKELNDSFEKGDIPESVRLLDKHFKANTYSLWHLFKDEQRKILNQILQITYEGVEASYRQIYDNNSAIMNFYFNLQSHLPRPLMTAAEYILNTDLKREFDHDPDVDKLRRIIDEIQRLCIRVDTTTVGFVVSSWIDSVMDKLQRNPDDICIIILAKDTLETLAPLSLQLNLWNVQNIYFSIGTRHFSAMKAKADAGDETATQWVDAFASLGKHLHVQM
jgi:hypothetical protein